MPDITLVENHSSNGFKDWFPNAVPLFEYLHIGCIHGAGLIWKFDFYHKQYRQEVSLCQSIPLYMFYFMFFFGQMLGRLRSVLLLPLSSHPGPSLRKPDYSVASWCTSWSAPSGMPLPVPWPKGLQTYLRNGFWKINCHVPNTLKKIWNSCWAEYIAMKMILMNALWKLQKRTVGTTIVLLPLAVALCNCGSNDGNPSPHPKRRQRSLEKLLKMPNCPPFEAFSAVLSICGATYKTANHFKRRWRTRQIKTVISLDQDHHTCFRRPLTLVWKTKFTTR